MNILKLTMAMAMVLVPCALLSAGVQDSPEWKRELDSAPRELKTGRTLVFSRAQLKYGLGGSYMSRWVDRPLFIDPEIPVDPKFEGALSFAEYVRIQQTLKQYGLDGFSFFPETSGRAYTYAKTDRSPVQDFRLLSEIFPNGRSAPSRRMEIIGQALECRHSLFIDGKLVLTSYGGDNAKPEYWKNLFDELRNKYGDKFIFICDISRKLPGGGLLDLAAKYREGNISLKDIAAIKEYLRSYLRATDGIYIAAASMMNNGQREFYTDYYRDFLAKLYKSVVSEPEFKDKYFALSAAVGHENCTAIGYIMSHNGTKTLRNSFESALAASPDIIVIPEWDEQNENTSLRPTVYNSLSSMRIMRHYMGRLKNEPLGPIPGDDLNIPNLIISYRKMLCLGEKISIELLNVPDAAQPIQETGWFKILQKRLARLLGGPGSKQKNNYTVKLALKDIAGRTVKEFPAEVFNAAELQDHTITVPSEEFARHQVLIPSLSIEFKGQKLAYEEGLHYIALRSTWNWDYKWVKQPLRDLLVPAKAVFNQIENPDGLLKSFSGEIVAPEDLSYVSVLDNDDVIYVAQGDAKTGIREDNSNKVISFRFQSMQKPKTFLGGQISVANAIGKWREVDDKSLKIEGGTLVFSNYSMSAGWPRQFYVSIPAGDVEKASLDISLPGIYTGKMPVKKIIDEQAFAISGEKGLCLSINRFIREIEFPRHLKQKRVSFKADLIPDLKTSVIHMEAITQSGKTYRSKPILIHQENMQTNKKEIIVFSDTKVQPVRIEVDAARVPVLDYHFTPEHGSALICDEGRAFWGILGGFVPQVTLRGGAESGGGNPFVQESYPPNAVKSCPDWVKEDDACSLSFDGKGTFAVLPQGVIPRRAAFEISMQIMPAEVNKRQFIIGNRDHYPGSLGSVYLENGFLKASEFLHAKVDFEETPAGNYRIMDSGIKIPAGQWSSIKITYDQENLSFEVNGQKSKKFKCAGPGLYDTLSVIGGFGENWFKGKIKNLKITHGT